MSWLVSAWVAPATLVGLILAGPKADRVQTFKCGNATCVEAKYGSPGDNFLKKINKAAITLGHVVIFRQDRVTRPRLRHELKHVQQWEFWGPSFFVVYPIAWKYFEKAADEAEKVIHDRTVSTGA